MTRRVEPRDRIEFRTGHSDHLDAGVDGGSGTPRTWTARSSARAPQAVARLAELAAAHPDSPLFGADNAGAEARDGRCTTAASPATPSAL